jgi:hypothetical protein
MLVYDVVSIVRVEICSLLIFVSMLRVLLEPGRKRFSGEIFGNSLGQMEQKV